MSDSTLRTAIARAISPDWWSDGIAVENREVKQEISLEQADAVLSVLADLPESVIERAAAQIYYWDIHPTSLDWEERPSGGQEDYREGARAMFRAAFGGEQSDG